MVIGAGPVDRDVILRARDMGIEVVAVDGDPKAVGLPHADVAVVYDIKDGEGLARLAREHNVDGVLCAGVEVGVRGVGAVGDALGLRTLSAEAALNATSKDRMRNLWSKEGVASANARKCLTLEEAFAAMQEFGLPVVVKPADSAGSRGVKYVANEAELEGAFSTALTFSRSRIVLVEEYMTGTEMSVEAFVVDGAFHVIALSDKIRTKPPYLLDVAVLFPSEQREELQQSVMSLVERAVEALGIDNSPIHAEVMLTPEGPRMVEVGARGPGFKVFTKMIPWSSGIDVVSAYIKLALGEEVSLGRSIKRGAVLSFPSAQPGRVVSVSGVDEARKVPGIHEVEIYVRPGGEVLPLTSGSARVGHIIALTETRADAEAAVKQAEEFLKIETHGEGV